MKLVNFRRVLFLLIILATFLSFLFSLNMAQAADQAINTSTATMEQTIISDSNSSTTQITTAQTSIDIATTTTSSTSAPQYDPTITTSTVTSSQSADSLLAITAVASSTASTTSDLATDTPLSTNTAGTPPTINFYLRYQDGFIWQGEVALTTSTIITYRESATSTLTTTTLTQPTALTALLVADQQSDNFLVSDLIYYADWGGSYYLNCLRLATTSACYNWQYAVNNQYPTVGMDKYNLTGGESVYLYYGTPWKVTASSSTTHVNATTTLTTWRYNYDNLTNEWTYDTDNLIDISMDNPSSTGWWDTTITIATTTSGSNGTVDYSFTATGTYYAKITSADWSKWSNPITLTVTAATNSTTASSTHSSIAVATGQTASAGDDATTTREQAVSEAEINSTANRLINYMRARQSTDGQIIDGNITDWAIMSVVANGLNPAEVKSTDRSLLDYAYNYDFAADSEINKCAAYARHALVLYSAGLPPTDELRQNLIAKIKSSSCYKNNVYGMSGINDDIFALLALLANDEQVNQEIIKTLIASIKNDQQIDGSFTWAGSSGYDITGAALNALKYARNKGIVIDDQILSKAKNYLKNNQLADGGWNNFASTSDILTTSWVIMGINGLGEGQTDWNKQGKNPWSVLTDQLKTQADQGYYESNWSAGAIDWFAIKHSIPALLGRSWPIEPKFSQIIIVNQTKKQPENAGGGFESANGTSTIYNTANATSTISNTNTTTTKMTANAADLTSSTMAVVADTTTTGANNSPLSGSINQTDPVAINTIHQTSIARQSTPTSLADKKIETTIQITTQMPQLFTTIPPSAQQMAAEQIINQPSQDIDARRAAEKVLAVSSSSALALGLYLGFKLLKNLI